MVLADEDEHASNVGFTAVKEAAEECNLRVSGPKTKGMVVGGGVKPDVLEFGGLKLGVVEEFPLVGSVVEAGRVAGKGLVEVRRRRGLAAGTFKALKKTLWKRREISLTTKMQVFNACVLSRLLYGSETWVVGAADLARLEAFHSNCLRRILRLSWMDKVSNVDVRKRCGQPTMEAILRQRRLRWVGRVQRMGGGRLPKVVMWGRLAKGNRRGGDRGRGGRTE